MAIPIIPVEAEDRHVELLVTLADGIIHETTPDVIRASLPSSVSDAKIKEYIATYSRPSNIPKFFEIAKRSINTNTIDATQQFILLATVLDSRILAPVLTNSLTLIRDMTLEQRGALLASWRDSPIAQKRRLFRVFYSLTIATFIKLASDLHNEFTDYPKYEPKDKLYESHVVDTFKYPMLEKPSIEGFELHIPDIDVIIIGSGSGAGVVAQTLCEEGFKSLILEKGKYYSNDELNFSDLEGYENLFQNGGIMATKNQQAFILAGSTFGGGSTVNWSACLRTPFKVRKEWYDDYGLEWAATDSYDKCQDYVWNKMGANHKDIDHAISNRTIIEGSEKLGYAGRPIEQNIGNHEGHNCGFCHTGCKFGVKQGSVNCWFKESANTGSKFMDQVRVLQIIHVGGKAVGVLCEDTTTGVKFKITGPKKFVVSGGSLNTPVILKQSGFKNKHIGRNLKLHPVSGLVGDFGKDVKTNSFAHPIMTSVCTEVDDIDGKAHGAKIETLLNTPFIQSVFTRWESSDQVRQELLNYNHRIILLLITRDKSSGTISYDPRRPEAIEVDYEVNKFDRDALHKSFLIGSDLLYIEGAKEIIMPQAWIPRFKSVKPKHERAITDKEYVEWRKAVEKIPFDYYGVPYGSAHQMSSCRISGKGPSNGALDLKGRLYECKNVYVADASVMPTASGANPMITTMTMSRYIALGIAKDLKPQAKL
ncbi:GMC oxidoreductase-domain-containing protein [Scheffersomyces coipomensis]|uniref:GMC oxidoreductase-domain-containing protein n=1 Tax=Scheffersomyces coipomensis TaxID=1788519 RepID=UPI00315D31AF